jgi:hypothetical protein
MILWMCFASFSVASGFKVSSEMGHIYKKKQPLIIKPEAAQLSIIHYSRINFRNSSFLIES